MLETGLTGLKVSLVSLPSSKVPFADQTSPHRVSLNNQPTQSLSTIILKINLSINHKAGVKAASVVKRYGVRLLPELYSLQPV